MMQKFTAVIDISALSLCKKYSFLPFHIKPFQPKFIHYLAPPPPKILQLISTPCTAFSNRLAELLNKGEDQLHHDRIKLETWCCDSEPNCPFFSPKRVQTSKKVPVVGYRSLHNRPLLSSFYYGVEKWCQFSILYFMDPLVFDKEPLSLWKKLLYSFPQQFRVCNLSSRIKKSRPGPSEYDT